MASCGVPGGSVQRPPSLMAVADWGVIAERIDGILRRTGARKVLKPEVDGRRRPGRDCGRVVTGTAGCGVPAAGRTCENEVCYSPISIL